MINENCFIRVELYKKPFNKNNYSCNDNNDKFKALKCGKSLQGRLFQSRGSSFSIRYSKQGCLERLLNIVSDSDVQICTGKLFYIAGPATERACFQLSNSTHVCGTLGSLCVEDYREAWDQKVKQECQQGNLGPSL